MILNERKKITLGRGKLGLLPSGRHAPDLRKKKNRSKTYPSVGLGSHWTARVLAQVNFHEFLFQITRGMILKRLLF